MAEQRYTELASQLARAIAPDLDSRSAAQHVLREIKADRKGGTRREWIDVSTALNTYSRTARIRVQSDLADGIDKCVSLLDGARAAGHGWQGDLPVQSSNVPQHMQLLLNLSRQPDQHTHDYAYEYLNPEPATGSTPDQMLYRQIMAEPFEGEHWGPGHDEEIVDGWTDSEDDGESEGDSPEEQEVLTPSTTRVRTMSKEPTEERGGASEQRLMEAKRRLDSLRRQAYWHPENQVPMPTFNEGLYGWRDLTTKGFVGSLPFSGTSPNGAQAPQVVISAQDLQRELIFVLSGRPGCTFQYRDAQGWSQSEDHPQVRYLSSLALSGILEVFADRASQASAIRSFIKDTLTPTSSSSTGPTKRCKTTEAFAEACRVFMQEYDQWLGLLEACFTTTPRCSTNETVEQLRQIASTPLALRRALDEKYEAKFQMLLSLIANADRPVILLDTIYTAYMSTKATSPRSPMVIFLLDIFTKTAAPMWSMLRVWLHQGMPIPTALIATAEQDLTGMTIEDERMMDPEFILQRDRDVSWTDEDFWEASYIEHEDGWPLWLQGAGVQAMIMEAGKARGLLRSLSTPAPELQPWPSLLATLSVDLEGESASDADISEKISSVITPICQIVTFQLRRVLEGECGLLEHLDAIEGLTFMRSFDVMEEWDRWVFDQVHLTKRWDFQTLTSSFRDIVEEKGAYWLNPSAIRITNSSRSKTDRRDGTPLSRIGGLRGMYTVPFPLSQLFTPTSMDIRSQVFAWLAQIRYALRSLALAPATTRSKSDRGETEPGLAYLRQRALWFMRVLSVWTNETVIEVQTGLYRESLTSTTSLAAMINLELKHVRRIRDFCFLHEKTSGLRELIVRVFEIATLIGSTGSVSPIDGTSGQRQPPKRRQGYRSRKRGEDTTDESEPESAGYDVTLDSSAEQADSLSTAEKVDRLKSEFDRLVLAIKAEVEDLASEAGPSKEEAETREVWGMLSFALEDWR